MENKIKEGTNIKLRDDLRVGEIYGGIYFSDKMNNKYKGKAITIRKILPNNVFTTDEYENFLFSYEMIESIITLDKFKLEDRVMDREGRIGTLTLDENDFTKFIINYDNGTRTRFFEEVLVKIKSEEKIHRDEKFKLSELSKFVKETKETKGRVDKLEEIAELYKEQIEVVSLIQKKLEEIIKKHDGFNIDVDVTIDNKIKEKLTETINKLSELGS